MPLSRGIPLPIPTPDGAGSYLAQLGRFPLLTREEETEIATRIEVSEQAVLAALVRCEAGIDLVRKLADGLRAGSVRVRDVARDFVAEDPEWEEAERRRLVAVADTVTRMAHPRKSLERRRAQMTDALVELRLNVRTVERMARVVSGEERVVADACRVAAAARAELVRGNLRLVVAVAKKYVNRGMAMIDLIQEGNIGLMRAVEKFEYRRGFKFSTYATWWIRQSIARSVAEQSHMIRTPVRMFELITRVRRTQQRFLQEFGRAPSTEETAIELEVPAGEVESAIRCMHEPRSLDAPLMGDFETCLGDVLHDARAVSPYEAAVHGALTDRAERMLACLAPREATVLRLRFGLGGEHEHTLEEIGTRFLLTRERIRQIEAKALGKLRKRSPDLAALLGERPASLRTGRPA